MARISFRGPRRHTGKVSRIGRGNSKSMVFGDPPSIQGLAHVTGAEPKVISHARARPRLWSKLLRGAGPERSVAPPLTPPRSLARGSRKTNGLNLGHSFREKRMSPIWDIRFFSDSQDFPDPFPEKKKISAQKLELATKSDSYGEMAP